MISASLIKNKSQRVATRLIQAAALAIVVLLAMPAKAADSREVQSKVAPVYPEMAKRMKIMGAVKIEAKVDADGHVTEVKTVDGNHMLSTAAEAAVRQWKFAPGAGVTTVQVELKFNLAL